MSFLIVISQGLLHNKRAVILTVVIVNVILLLRESVVLEVTKVCIGISFFLTSGSYLALNKSFDISAWPSHQQMGVVPTTAGVIMKIK